MKKLYIFHFFLVITLHNATSTASMCYTKPGIGPQCLSVVNDNTFLTSPNYNCSGITFKALCNNTKICYTNNTGQLNCESIPKNKTLTISGETKATTIGQVTAMIYRPSSGKTQGLKNLTDIDSLPGFPEGKILVTHQPLTFPLNPKLHRNLSEFTLYQQGNKKPIITINSTIDSVTLPAATLAPKTKYEWRAIIGKKSYKGIFQTISEKHQKMFESTIEEQTKTGADDSYSKLILQAALANKWGLGFNTNHFIGQIKQHPFHQGAKK